MPAPLPADLHAMKQYFGSGATQSYGFRIEQLKRLRDAIIRHEEQIAAALFADLHKSPEEAWVTETGLVLNELKYAIKKLRRWMKPQRAKTNLLNFPSRSRILSEPYGTVLIIAPWNYPLQLLFSPLVGALAAGNCVVLKPSEFAKHTERLMEQIITGIFPKEYVYYAKGEGAKIIPDMMNGFDFNYVFYTGGTRVGKEIYKMAADKLIPVTLELGGKSPCVVTAKANLKVSARRIAFAKFSNAGQMCVAPDYVLVHDSVQQEFLNELKQVVQSFFGDDPSRSDAFGRIINEQQFDRISGYLQQGEISAGGKSNRSQLYISPTILTGVSSDDPVMKEEIFGPVLPVLTYTTEQSARDIISQNPDPLAFYIYSSDHDDATSWLQAVASGGACVNNCSLHVANHHLPFGGRGYSGMGKYHGRFSFETFSHQKAVLKTPLWFDPKMKYPPFTGKLSLFKKVIG